MQNPANPIQELMALHGMRRFGEMEARARQALKVAGNTPVLHELLGIALCAQQRFEEALRPFGNIAYIVHMRTHWLRDTGACQSPFASFLTLLGIETLHLRLERHSKNALAVARFLEKHPAVASVNYPGLPGHPDHANAKKYLPDGAGGIVGFGIKGGKEAGVRLINNVKLFSHLANIGDAKSLIIHPATTTHSQLTPEEQAQTGVTPEFVRLSIGIEDAEDIKADLDQALRASQAS